jgi:hypothetical protein
VLPLVGFIGNILCAKHELIPRRFHLVLVNVHIPEPCCFCGFVPSGFTGDFWRAYHELIPKAPLFDKRKELYLLYHYLNHTNLFGGEQPLPHE